MIAAGLCGASRGGRAAPPRGRRGRSGAPSPAHRLPEHLGFSAAFDDELGDAPGGARSLQHDVTVSGVVENETYLASVHLRHGDARDALRPCPLTVSFYPDREAPWATRCQLVDGPPRHQPTVVDDDHRPPEGFGQGGLVA